MPKRKQRAGHNMADQLSIKFRRPGDPEQKDVFTPMHDFPGRTGRLYVAHDGFTLLCFHTANPYVLGAEFGGFYVPFYAVTEVGPTVLPGFAGWSRKAMMGQTRCVWPESARRVFETIYIALLRSAVPDDLIQTWILPCLGSRDFEQ